MRLQKPSATTVADRGRASASESSPKVDIRVESSSLYRHPKRFLHPQKWVGLLVIPVVEVPGGARGSLGVPGEP